MKRKRKPKDNFVFADIMIEMTWHGCKRGVAFGAIYGVLMLLEWEQGLPYRTFLSSVPLAMLFGLPFGAIFGMFAGVVLGIMNGLLIDIFTRLSSLRVNEWIVYRLSLGSLCGIATLVGGVIVFGMVFDVVNMSIAPGGYFAFVVAPALIAAIVLAHASQHAADRYIGALDTAE